VLIVYYIATFSWNWKHSLHSTPTKKLYKRPA